MHSLMTLGSLVLSAHSGSAVRAAAWPHSSRLLAAVTAAVLVLGILAVRAVPVHAAPPPPAGDFNGDGFSDLAIGAPKQDFTGIKNAGGVSVVYGSASGLDAACSTTQR